MPDWRLHLDVIDEDALAHYDALIDALQTPRGLERTLRTPEHFAGAVGSLVSVKTRPGVDGDRRIKGTLVSADATTATIAPSDAAPGATRVLALDDISRARTVFEWGAAPKPGSGSKPGAAPTSSPSAKKKAAKS